MKRLSLLVAVAAFVLGACERHSWEDEDKNGDGVIDQNEKGTKRLYHEHGGEGSHPAPGGENAAPGKGEGGTPAGGAEKHP